MRDGERMPELSERQRAVAKTGVKALIPVGRPFLDYVLHQAAEAGVSHVCLVTGPEHHELRRYYANLSTNRLRIDFAVQAEAWGTAHAVAAAEPFVGDDPFLMLNSDNCYPSEALRQLRNANCPGVVGFERDSLLKNSNLTLPRLAGFALIQPDVHGFLLSIVEKPGDKQLRDMKAPVLVGMNCWCFPASIFESCRRIPKSSRGEYEITDAVEHNMRSLGERYRVVSSPGPVLDLSSGNDIHGVKQRLQGQDVRL